MQSCCTALAVAITARMLLRQGFRNDASSFAVNIYGSRGTSCKYIPRQVHFGHRPPLERVRPLLLSRSPPIDSLMADTISTGSTTINLDDSLGALLIGTRPTVYNVINWKLSDPTVGNIGAAVYAVFPSARLHWLTVQPVSSE